MKLTVCVVFLVLLSKAGSERVTVVEGRGAKQRYITKGRRRMVWNLVLLPLSLSGGDGRVGARCFVEKVGVAQARTGIWVGVGSQ